MTFDQDVDGMLESGVCCRCGCTEEDPCYPGERWAELGLCASCAGQPDDQGAELCARIDRDFDRPPYRQAPLPRRVA